MQFKRKYFITTPIFYPSGDPHVGHAFTAVLGDFLKRFYAQRGADVFYLTGTDEHGKKISEKARAAGVSPQQFVDANAKKFADLFAALRVGNDRFVRTTEPNHKLAVQKVFAQLQSRGQIYKGVWEGLYCVECEENYAAAQATKNESGEPCCKIGHRLIEAKENSYFVKFSAYAPWIKKQLEANALGIYPASRTNELVNNFLNAGLKDLSISRESVSWGVQVPNDPKSTIYVWIDALFNYVSALDFSRADDALFKKYWDDDACWKIHLISKDIARFHCIYWPILLEMLGMKLPSEVIAHGWIVDEKGGKMSKSLGNVVDPTEWIGKYGADAVRYYFLKDFALDQDNRCGHGLFASTYNADLANNLGNLVSRTIGMLKKYQGGVIQPHAKFTRRQLEIADKIKALPDAWDEAVASRRLRVGFDACLGLVFDVNKLIEDTKPWELHKAGKADEIANLLFLASAAIRAAFVLLRPVLVTKSEEAFAQMNFGPEITGLDSLNAIESINGIRVGEPKPLFERIA